MSFEDILPELRDPHPYMRRKIIFGHRNYNSVLRAMERHEPFAVMSGFMPSGRAHFGHMMVMNEIIWHQKQGADAFAAIADMEAHAVRGVSWERCRQLGINEYIVSLIALGFQPKENSHIYFQSENYKMRNLAFESAARPTSPRSAPSMDLPARRISHIWRASWPRAPTSFILN